MSICSEEKKIGSRYFVHTWSDAGCYVVGGYPEGEYEDAWDPKTQHRSYVEGRKIEDYKEE